MEFINACHEFVIARVISAWYFTLDKDAISFDLCGAGAILKSITILIRYHLGTIAFGSCIIATIQFIRAILSFVQEQLKGAESKVAKYIVTCLKCCFYCLEKILKYINKNAYIMTGE